MGRLSERKGRVIPKSLKLSLSGDLVRVGGLGVEVVRQQVQGGRGLRPRQRERVRVARSGTGAEAAEDQQRDHPDGEHDELAAEAPTSESSHCSDRLRADHMRRLRPSPRLWCSRASRRSGRAPRPADPCRARKLTIWPPAKCGEEMTNVHILGSGGGAPSAIRETACYLIRDGERTLLVDIGTGARRLFERPAPPGRCRRAAHRAHALSPRPRLRTCRTWRRWRSRPRSGRRAAWLYGREASRILEPLRRPPIAPTDQQHTIPVRELRARRSRRSAASESAPPSSRTTGHPRPDCASRTTLALITDTPYEPSSSTLAERGLAPAPRSLVRLD